MDNTKDYQSEILRLMAQMQRKEHPVNNDHINKNQEELTKKYNSSPQPRFNGFSPDQMGLMAYFPFHEGCPVQIRTLTDEEIETIPFMRQALHLLKALELKDLKLTPKGNLPIKMVETLYQMGSHSWGSDWFNQKTEDRIPEVHVLRAVLKETGLIKVRFGKLSLTAKGKKLLAADHNELLKTIVMFLFTAFHTGWHDSYEDYYLGNGARLYSLWLLHHYGDQWRDEKFYAKEYFKAFPKLWKETGMEYLTYEDLYTLRVFHRLFYIIGLCEFNKIINKEEHTSKEEVRKTHILDMIFTFQEPAKIKNS